MESKPLHLFVKAGTLVLFAALIFVFVAYRSGAFDRSASQQSQVRIHLPANSPAGHSPTLQGSLASNTTLSNSTANTVFYVPALVESELAEWSKQQVMISSSKSVVIMDPPKFPFFDGPNFGEQQMLMMSSSKSTLIAEPDQWKGISTVFLNSLQRKPKEQPVFRQGKK